mgnify:CR=1 FL=1
MVADVATKPLDLKQFEFCRDVLNGYGLLKAGGKTELPTAAAAAALATSFV